MRPMGLALDASGRTLYVATGRAARVLALDMQSGEVLASADVGPRAWGLALCADEQRLYSANGPSDDVSVIDVASFRTLGRVKAGAKPWGAVCAPAAKADTHR
jgi:YVTN family beta-propeller protein